MSQSTEPWEELGLLAAALCDGKITPQEASRLEQLAGQSADARRFLLQYLQLHGELYWEHAASVSSAGDAGFRPSDLVDGSNLRTEARTTNGRLRWVAVALAASLLLAVAWWWSPWRFGQPRVAPVAAARVTWSVAAQWQDSPRPDGTKLAVGDRLQLAEGLAEIAFVSGARVILEGPALLELESPERVNLQHGSLAARVDGPAKGFAVRTPSLAVVDLGTEFGVTAQTAGPSEVHVFVGQVQVRPQIGAQAGAWQAVTAGRAVRVAMASDGKLPKLEQIPAEEFRFARSLPPPGAGSVGALRELVSRHPRLIHHYTFEGFTPEVQRRDRRGDLHLIEAVMRDGRGGGDVLYRAPGLDATSRAVRPHRGLIDGNTSGMGLQSETAFQPPQAMTVELLANLAPMRGNETTPIACALATRADARRCGFFLAAVEQGYLTQLLDGDAPWVEGRENFALAADDWYYAASTLSVESGKTRVNTYVANLSRGERALNWVMRDELAPGTPATSRLGIGKGFDAVTAHAYPWSGLLDEVAIYDTALDRTTLEQHLAALVGPSGKKETRGTARKGNEKP